MTFKEEPTCELIQLSQLALSCCLQHRPVHATEVPGDHPRCAVAHLQAWQQVLVQATYVGARQSRMSDPNKEPKQLQGLQLGSSQKFKASVQDGVLSWLCRCSASFFFLGHKLAKILTLKLGSRSLSRQNSQIGVSSRLCIHRACSF